jgi:hypothetical protein
MNRRKIIGLLTVLLVGGLGVILSGPAYAACTSSFVGFNSYAYGSGCTGSGGTVCEVVTPVSGHTSADVISSFWAYKGTGAVGGNQGSAGAAGCSADASTTCGVDNGLCTAQGGGGAYCGWLFDTGPGRMGIGGGWNGAGQDSCIVGKTAPGHTLPIMIMSFVDQDPATGQTFVALAAGEFFSDQIRFDGTRGLDSSGSSRDIVLVPISQFGSFTGSTKNSDTNRHVNFNAPPAPLAGVYTDGTSLSGAEIAGLIKGFRVYADEGPTTNDRLRNGGPNTWNAMSLTLPYGSPGGADVTCTTATSVVDRLAYTVVFDSDWETEMVSGNSPQTVGCGPTLATPGTPGKKIEKPGLGQGKKGTRTR